MNERRFPSSADALIDQLEDLEDTVTFLKNACGETDLLILQQEESQTVARRRSAASPE